MCKKLNFKLNKLSTALSLYFVYIYGVVLQYRASYVYDVLEFWHSVVTLPSLLNVCVQQPKSLVVSNWTTSWTVSFLSWGNTSSNQKSSFSQLNSLDKMTWMTENLHRLPYSPQHFNGLNVFVAVVNFIGLLNDKSGLSALAPQPEMIVSSFSSSIY